MNVDAELLGEAAVFEGVPVTEVAVEIPNVSGGLNRAMPIAPVVVHKGDEFYVVAKVEADKFRHEPVDKKDEASPWRRVQIAPAAVVAVATGDLVDACAEFLADQQRKIDAYEADVEAAEAQAKQAAKDAAAGQTTIGDFVDNEKVSADAKNLPGEPGNTAAGKGDEVGAKRAEKVSKSSKATKSAGRQVTPIPKKAQGAKKAPAKKASGARKRTH
jgi:hypothetical protein